MTLQIDVNYYDKKLSIADNERFFRIFCSYMRENFYEHCKNVVSLVISSDPDKKTELEFFKYKSDFDTSQVLIDFFKHYFYIRSKIEDDIKIEIEDNIKSKIKDDEEIYKKNHIRINEDELSENIKFILKKCGHAMMNHVRLRHLRNAISSINDERRLNAILVVRKLRSLEQALLDASEHVPNSKCPFEKERLDKKAF
jgi:hypothetical protein